MPLPIGSTRAHANVSTLPRLWKSLRTCAITHPLHLELETVLLFSYGCNACLCTAPDFLDTVVAILDPAVGRVARRSSLLRQRCGASLWECPSIVLIA